MGTVRWRRWALIGGALAVSLVLAGWIAVTLLTPGPVSSRQLTTEARAQVQLTGGARIYAATCAYCHDTKIAPSLRGRNLDAGVVTVFVREGPGAMPAFSPGHIDDADLTALADFVAGLPATGAP